MIVPKYGTLPGLGQAQVDRVLTTGAFGPFPGSRGRLSDAEIRCAVRTASADVDLRLEEVECWRGYARADFICLSTGAVSVIEIKSDRDSLSRLAEQVRVYSSIAERVTLVVGWHLAARALRLAPAWWDVVLAERDGVSEVRLIPLRDGTPNPDSNIQGLLAMLPLYEVRRLAAESGGAPSWDRREGLRRVIAANVSEQKIRGAVARWLAELATRRASVTT